MTKSYAQERLLEALAKSRGNFSAAKRLIMTWAASDHKLLLELTGPHLTGIVAHALNRTQQNKSLAAVKRPSRPVTASKDPNEKFGKELLKTFATDKPVKFAEEGFSAPIKRPAASQAHIDAINLLAGKPKKT